MNMTPDEAAAADAIARLTKALDAIKPHVETLHLRIINHGCKAAHWRLGALVNAADEMIDFVRQEDFMQIERYVQMAKELNDLCACDECASMQAERRTPATGSQCHD
jgi:hypothetical protein